MHAAVDAFLNYLKIERNASALTIKSYADDMSHVLEFLQEQTGSIPDRTWRICTNVATLGPLLPGVWPVCAAFSDTAIARQFAKRILLNLCEHLAPDENCRIF